MIICLHKLKLRLTTMPTHSHVLADFGAYTNDDWVIGVAGSVGTEDGSGRAIHGVLDSLLAQHCECSIWLDCALAIAARRLRGSGSSKGTPLQAWKGPRGKLTARKIFDFKVSVGEPASD